MEQLTFLLFLKMADEQVRPPFNPPSSVGLRRAGKPLPIPKGKDWPALLAKIARQLSVVEELEAVGTANLQRATRLRQSILQKAFTGKLLTADDADSTDGKKKKSAPSA